jgi:predicted amidohydrolase
MATLQVKPLNEGKKPARPLDVTASICNDLSFPGAFRNLRTRPGLILAPASTWDSTIGLAMWEQAKARAIEMRSVVLWCDGGSGGVSGVFGTRVKEVTQVGTGTWRTIVVLPYLQDTSRSTYMVLGDWWLICFAWIAVFGTAVNPRFTAIGRLIE